MSSRWKYELYKTNRNHIRCFRAWILMNLEVKHMHSCIWYFYGIGCGFQISSLNTKVNSLSKKILKIILLKHIRSTFWQIYPDLLTVIKLYYTDSNKIVLKSYSNKIVWLKIRMDSWVKIYLVIQTSSVVHKTTYKN